MDKRDVAIEVRMQSDRPISELQARLTKIVIGESPDSKPGSEMGLLSVAGKVGTAVTWDGVPVVPAWKAFGAQGRGWWITKESAVFVFKGLHDVFVRGQALWAFLMADLENYVGGVRCQWMQNYPGELEVEVFFADTELGEEAARKLAEAGPGLGTAIPMVRQDGEHWEVVGICLNPGGSDLDRLVVVADEKGCWKLA